MAAYEVEEPRYERRGGWLDRLDWGGVRQEVEAESRAEIVLLGPPDAGKSALYASLRGLPLVVQRPRRGNSEQSVEEMLGLFALLDLPLDDQDEGGLLERLDRATLLVYLLDGAIVAGAADAVPSSVGAVSAEDVSANGVARPLDLRWLARLHALGRPTMVALTKADLWSQDLDRVLQTVERRLGEPVAPISAFEPAAYQNAFLQQMVALCPQLAVPLGREVTGFRHSTAQRLIIRTALMTGVVSLEPIPLLDLPVQLGAQVGLVARIATMHGHMPTSDYCRELVLAAAGGALLRAGAQQVVKVVPVVGWIVSGLLGGVATWVVGQTALAVFEQQLTLDRVRDSAQAFAQRAWQIGLLHPFQQARAWVREASARSGAFLTRQRRRPYAKRRSRSSGIVMWPAERR